MMVKLALMPPRGQLPDARAIPGKAALTRRQQLRAAVDCVQQAKQAAKDT